MRKMRNCKLFLQCKVLPNICRPWLCTLCLVNSYFSAGCGRPAVSAFLTRQHFIQNNLYEDRSHISPFMKTDLTSHIGLICLSHFNWLHPPIHKLRPLDFTTEHGNMFDVYNIKWFTFWCPY